LVIELLASSPDGLTLGELVDQTDIVKSSAFRILETLCEAQYLYRDSDTRKFRLSGKLLAVGYKASGNLNLVENAISIMRQLRDTIRETVLIGSVIGEKFVVLEQVLGLYPFKFIADVGMQTTLHSNAPGKAILAFLPEELQREVLATMKLPRYTDHTITEKKRLLEHLQQIKQRGYATDHAEEIEGVHCIGAPVFDRIGYPIAAIWITGPLNRFAEEKTDELGHVVMEHANQISLKMGYAVEPSIF
jgi:DNA-binding IclR family transcriptional regulator